MGITNPGEEYFKDGGWSWTGSEWIKGGLPFEYESQVIGSVVEATGDAGRNDLVGPAVPPGYIWVITAMMAFNAQHGLSLVQLGVLQGANLYLVAATGALLVNVGYSWSGNLYLVAGDKPQAKLDGVTLNDYLYFAYAGYQMRIT